MIRLSIPARITILSIICTIGISFLLLGCVLPKSYWPLFILLIYVFLPIPLLIASSCNQNGNNVAVVELALFITAVLFVSTFGLPVVMYMKGYIQTQGFIFALIGNIILISAGFVYALLFHRRQNDFLWSMTNKNKTSSEIFVDSYTDNNVTDFLLWILLDIISLINLYADAHCPFHPKFCFLPHCFSRSKNFLLWFRHIERIISNISEINISS